MLKPAAVYKNEIENKSKELYYTKDYMYYTGWYDNRSIEIYDNPGSDLFQYAIISNDNKLIGYLSYRVDWYSSCAYSFGLISFDKGNPILGFDLLIELNKIINTYKIHRIEYRVVADNPVKKHYDKFCKRMNGNIIKLTDVFKDNEGNYHDEYIYEIIIKRN